MGTLSRPARVPAPVSEAGSSSAWTGAIVADLRAGALRIYGRLREIYGRAALSMDEARQAIEERTHPDDIAEVRRLFAAIRAGRPHAGELRIYMLGEPRRVRLRTRPVHAENGRPAAAVCIVRGLDPARADGEELRRRAYVDTATGLPNRAALFAGEMVPGPIAGALLLVLADPGPASPMRPHDVRARNASATARKLVALLPHGARVARYSEEIFAVVLPHGPRKRAPLGLARRIVAAFQHPLAVGDEAILVSPAVGIGMAVQPTAIAELNRRAGVALAEARQSDASYAVYSEAFDLAQRRRATIDRRLRGALADRSVGVAYQPVVSLATGRIVGAEALMRYTCPELGPVEPSEFIPIAEESATIVRLGEWIVREACAQARRWELAGYGALRIAVNVSPRQVQQRGFVRFVAGVAAKTKLPLERLELEVTESLMLDRTVAVRNLAALRRAGARIVLDDFGTGYSGLSCLDELPLDAVKIDRSFVEAVGEDGFKERVAETVVRLAHALGLTTIAEGVERPEQLARLRAMGCDAAQGFLLGRPVDADAFARLLGAGASA